MTSSRVLTKIKPQQAGVYVVHTRKMHSYSEGILENIRNLNMKYKLKYNYKLS